VPRGPDVENRGGESSKWGGASSGRRPHLENTAGRGSGSANRLLHSDNPDPGNNVAPTCLARSYYSILAVPWLARSAASTVGGALLAGELTVAMAEEGEALVAIEPHSFVQLKDRLTFENFVARRAQLTRSVARAEVSQIYD
jgi:hypothetical protein